MTTCMRCKTAFTIIRRYHHCRCCGQVVCGTCSTEKLPVPSMGYTIPVRVCNECGLHIKANKKLCVARLSTQLRCNIVDVQMKAASELASGLANDKSGVQNLNIALENLINLLNSSDSEQLRFHVCRALSEAVTDEGVARTLVDAGAVTTFVSLMESGKTELRVASMKCIARLARFPYAISALRRTDVFSIVVDLLSSNDTQAHEWAARTIEAASSTDADTRKMLVGDSSYALYSLALLLSSDHQATQEASCSALSALLSGDSTSQAAALQNLIRADALGPLVRLLTSQNKSVASHALQTLKTIIGINPGLIGPMAVSGLVSVLQSGDAPASALAAACLVSLMQDQNAAMALTRMDATFPLFQLCSGDGVASEEHRADCVYLFSRICSNPALKSQIRSSGGVPLLCDLFASSSSLIRVRALRAAAELCEGEPSCCQAVWEGGAVKGIATALSEVVSGQLASPEAEFEATRCIAALAPFDVNRQLAIQYSAHLPLLSILHTSTSMDTKRYAIQALEAIASTGQRSRELLIASGLVQAIGDLVTSDHNAFITSLPLLVTILSVSRDACLAFVNNHNAVGYIVSLLQSPVVDDAVRERCLAIYANLAQHCADMRLLQAQAMAPTLANLMKSPSIGVQVQAVLALEKLSHDDNNSALLRNSLLQLIQSLATGQGSGMKAALAAAICNIAPHGDAAEFICRNRGVETLLGCIHGDVTEDVTRNVLRALSTLAVHPFCRQTMIDVGAVPLFLNMLNNQASGFAVLDLVVSCLFEISKDPRGAGLIYQSQGIPVLVNRLLHSWRGMGATKAPHAHAQAHAQPKAQPQAHAQTMGGLENEGNGDNKDMATMIANTLAKVVNSSPQALQDALALGGMDVLTAVLHVSGSEDTSALALDSMLTLSNRGQALSTEAQAEVVKQITTLITSRNIHTQQKGCEALYTLLSQDSAASTSTASAAAAASSSPSTSSATPNAALLDQISQTPVPVTLLVVLANHNTLALSSETVEQAVCSLAILAKSPTCVSALAPRPELLVLLELFSHDSARVRAQSALVLARLGTVPSVQQFLLQANAIEALTSLISLPDRDGQAAGLEALACVAVLGPAVKDALLDNGTINIVTRFLKTNNSKVQGLATLVLERLCSTEGSDDIVDMLVKSSGIQALLTMIGSGDHKLEGRVLSLVLSLSRRDPGILFGLRDNPQSIQTLMALISCVNRGEVRKGDDGWAVASNATIVLARLAGVSACRIAFKEPAILNEIVLLLSVDDVAIQLSGCSILGNVAASSACRETFLSTGAISALMKCVQCQDAKLKSTALWALENLSIHAECRKVMLEAGLAKYLIQFLNKSLQAANSSDPANERSFPDAHTLFATSLLATLLHYPETAESLSTDCAPILLNALAYRNPEFVSSLYTATKLLLLNDSWNRSFKVHGAFDVFQAMKETNIPSIAIQGDNLQALLGH
eukprot:TRINITY_DN2138_c0_g1::TRINITY_DN2138_c0_g1_i3::g.12887::m.12887 TRINITY_DN2138_c0_g1::TRINITY_DN2138_c0_g1_i3::g.12887  ORF type:complete len:1617 (+),score=226.30,sp/B4JHI7/LST2_DROGR/50.85/6e-14,Arm/PF00514.18/3,Arm/PF00514.18/0.89,Arm/PF00514.18/3.7e+03,Arm/PF00514.18/4.8,Arm/PF00514.18/0.014,Arm/PF00514.18/0.0091,Arm/PF00514.18/5.2e+03,Arm/PF00514.18/1.9e+02,Arm/PF00514.18/1.2e+03,Arm/PF00514.18/2.9e+02,Arm/PF00514.18/0.83,Arm/PF00514.18/4.1e+03,Arm/PF00514.18/17,Arm/PF00514.18/0.27,Arm/PF00